MKWYRLYHEAWMENPPADWLVASYLQYKSPNASHKTALENTRRVADTMKAMEQLAKMKEPNQ